MNWNYSSAELEDSLYEEVQGPEEGEETGDGGRTGTTDEHDSQRGQVINGVPGGNDTSNCADNGKGERVDGGA